MTEFGVVTGEEKHISRGSATFASQGGQHPPKCLGPLTLPTPKRFDLKQRNLVK